ncbi:unnamed protein product [Closterium sp. Yama58-4]|nr:unnamed protein product [Closterium sp. Yama58-4]
MPALAECDQVRRLPHSILATYETSKGGFDALDASNSSKLAVGKPEPSDSLADASKTRETTVSLSGTKRPHASAFEGSSEREKSERRTPNKEARIFCSPHRSVLTTVDGVDSSPSRADIGRVNRTPSSGQAELDSRLTLPTNAGFSTPNSHLKVPSNSTSETSTEFSTPQGDGSRIPVPAECPGTPKKCSTNGVLDLVKMADADATTARAADQDADAQVPRFRRNNNYATAATGPAATEHKRLRRLLRNRVSAQQARERRKQYLSELEGRVSQLDQRNAELKETLSTLQRENFMLRQVARNTAQAADAPPSH